jgi:hypothetical protein
MVFPEEAKKIETISNKKVKAVVAGRWRHRRSVPD